MNKKVHFYIPKKKIDVENQTFFDDYDRVLHNDNIFDRQYQAALNSLFDYEPPENEIEKMIKSDYSSRIEFYMTKLHDDRFDPLTPSNELFSNATPQICLDIRNEGFAIWKYEIETNGTDPNLKNDQGKYLSFSFDNDAEVIYSIVESFFTGRINFHLLRIIDRLHVSYGPSGSILCEVIDSRFKSNSTYLYDFDEENVSKKRIILHLSNSSIYYHISLARQSFIRKKNVRINNSNNEAQSLNNDSTNSNRSISSMTSVPNVTNNQSLPNSSAITPESFHSIKRNDSTPNIVMNSNLNHTQMLDSNSGVIFSQVKNEALLHNKFKNDNGQIMMNLQNHSFNHDSSQAQMGEYYSGQNVDPSLTQMNSSIPNQNFNDSAFQIPIQSMNSRTIQGDNQSQVQFQNQYGKQQQIQKQKQQKHSNSHIQKQQHQLQKLQQQLLQQQQQQSIQQLQAQSQPQTPNIDLPINNNNNSNNQEEPQPKSKSKSNMNSSQNDSSSPAASQHSPISGSNVVYEVERKLVLLLNPIFISDPSPDVCRASSVLDFRKKMWSQTPSSFMNNYNQMKSRFSVDSNPRKAFNTNIQHSRHSYQINPPKGNITIPDTISQMFISKNMIKFTTY